MPWKGNPKQRIVSRQVDEHWWEGILDLQRCKWIRKVGLWEWMDSLWSLNLKVERAKGSWKGLYSSALLKIFCFGIWLVNRFRLSAMTLTGNFRNYGSFVGRKWVPKSLAYCWPWKDLAYDVEIATGLSNQEGKAYCHYNREIWGKHYTNSETIYGWQIHECIWWGTSRTRSNSSRLQWI